MDLRIQGNSLARAAERATQLLEAGSSEQTAAVQNSQADSPGSSRLGYAESVSVSLQAQALEKAFTQLNADSQTVRQMLGRLLQMGLLDRLVSAVTEGSDQTSLLQHLEALDGEATETFSVSRQEDADGRQKGAGVEAATVPGDQAEPSLSAARSSVQKILAGIMEVLVDGAEAVGQAANANPGTAAMASAPTAPAPPVPPSGQPADAPQPQPEAKVPTPASAEAPASRALYGANQFLRPGNATSAGNRVASPVPGASESAIPVPPTTSASLEAARVDQTATPLGAPPEGLTPVLKTAWLTQAIGKQVEQIWQSAEASDLAKPSATANGAASAAAANSGASAGTLAPESAAPLATSSETSFMEMARQVAARLSATVNSPIGEGQEVLAKEFVLQTRNLVTALLTGSPEGAVSPAVSDAESGQMLESLWAFSGKLMAVATTLQPVATSLAPQAEGEIESLNNILGQIREALGGDAKQPLKGLDRPVVLDAQGQPVTVRELAIRGFSFELTAQVTARVKEIQEAPASPIRKGSEEPPVRLQAVDEPSTRFRVTVSGETQRPAHPVALDLTAPVKAEPRQAAAPSAGEQPLNTQAEARPFSAPVPDSLGIPQTAVHGHQSASRSGRENATDAASPRANSETPPRYDFARAGICTRQDPIFVRIMAQRGVRGEALAAEDYTFVTNPQPECRVPLLEYKPVEVIPPGRPGALSGEAVACEQTAAAEPLDVEFVYS